MRYKYCKGREKIIISYTSNDCLPKGESTSKINERVHKSCQIQKSICWPSKEWPVIKHNEKIIPTKIWNT